MGEFIEGKEQTTAIMYGEQNLAEYPIFQGGFINYGFWDKVPDDPTKEDRVRASSRLYEEIFNGLDLSSDDEILEFGCGLGLGCLMAIDKYKVKNAYGLDASPEQIERCKKRHATRLEDSKIQFVQGFANNTSFPDEKFTKVYSVEAAQHFPSLPDFFQEAFRVLKPGAKFVFATFFKEADADLAEISKFIPTVEKKIDFFHAIEECPEFLKVAGFTNVQTRCIGEYVWKGFDKWCTVSIAESWGNNWLKIYKKNLVDYYIVEAIKPA